MIDMKPGTTTAVDGTMHHCQENNNNIQYYTKRMGCTKYGNSYKEGEQFAINHLRYECKNGMVDIIGCYTDQIGRNIEIGESTIEKNMLYKCYIENGEVKYEQHPCGLEGFPACKVTRRQQPPVRIPASGQGFGAFSIAQVGIHSHKKIILIKNLYKTKI
uniref:Dynactin subunit 6 n=1 Tax=Elaeophora elaphi TaxID=1147741 RepID=A0A0R3RRR7_9BILA